MKKIFVVLAAVIAMSCGDSNREKGDATSESANSEENVDENSGDNISPQLEDSAGRMEVDTIKSAAGAQQQKDSVKRND